MTREEKAREKAKEIVDYATEHTSAEKMNSSWYIDVTDKITAALLSFNAGEWPSEAALLEMIREWKFFWHKQSGYEDRAWGIDSNMMHNLCERLSQPDMPKVICDPSIPPGEAHLRDPRTGETLCKITDIKAPAPLSEEEICIAAADYTLKHGDEIIMQECDCIADDAFRAGARFARGRVPDDVVEPLEVAKKELEHDQCYATGPLTGDPIADHVICPGCLAINKIRAALAKLRGK